MTNRACIVAKRGAGRSPITKKTDIRLTSRQRTATHCTTGRTRSTVELRCVACRGPLKVEGSNPTNVMVGCTACGTGHHVANKET